MTGDSSVAATTPTMTRPVPCDYWRLGRLKSDYSTRLVLGLARATNTADGVIPPCNITRQLETLSGSN